MARNQSSWPRLWLMTDERIGASLFDAIDRLPDGQAGIVLRHYATPPPERTALARRIATLCRARRLTLAIAGDMGLAREVGADLIHNPTTDPGGLPVSRSTHSEEQAKEAASAGASLLFLSPIFPTRSHPGRPAIAREEARRILVAISIPVIALGGMDARRFAEREADGFYGWAAIDAWLGENQNLKAVPT